MRSRFPTAILRPLLMAAALTFPTAVLAQTLAIHPFDSQETLLGVAVADEIAAAFADYAFVLGPDVTAGAIPPIVVEGGFVAVGRLVGPVAMTGAAGASLLRSGLGVDVAATGRVRSFDDGLELELYIAAPTGVQRRSLRSDEGRPDRLAVLATRALEEALGLASGSAATPRPGWDLDGSYGAYVRGIALLGSGLVPEGAAAIEEGLAGGGAPERASEILADVRSLLDGDVTLPAGETEDESTASTTARRAARRALLAVTTATLDETVARAAFEQMRGAWPGALADSWLGVLAANVNDRSGALAALDAAAEASPYGRVVRASFLASRGDTPAALADLDDVLGRGAAAGSAALLGASVVANVVTDTERERAALAALSAASPFLTYPFERLSYLAFDRNDARAAAEALAVAVELEPESDLYWTNLGWAYYLLGFLTQSEEASSRALELDGSQYIAAYNLGLARVVTGRLQEAMRAYDQALRFDPAVDDEAVQDLENARLLYPETPEVEYALGTLYEAEGRRSEAAAAFRRFLRRSAAGTDDPFVRSARDRYEALSAPPPPLEILGGVRVTLGVRGASAAPYHPGDPLYPSFEVSTPGDELPARLTAAVALVGSDAAGEERIVTERELTLPAGAVGYVVDDIELLLPDDLPEGTYVVRVSADGGDGQRVEAETTIDVAGEPQALRQLLGRGVVLTELQSGAPLYDQNDLSDPEVAVTRMLRELRTTASAAENALPVVEAGRFEGMTGGEAFEASTPADVRDFLAYLVASDMLGGRFTFVDAYAQWVLDATPPAP
ncbi:MAG: tetratricopeptide repeat protein [Trueperaceae bacterium]